jgi:hypothetical protein
MKNKPAGGKPNLWVVGEGDPLDDCGPAGKQPPQPPKQQSEKDVFAMVPLAWAAEIAEEADMSSYMIFTLLAYLAWKAKGPTFTLSNDILKQYGISRWAKYRALARLERAGAISVRCDLGKAAVVTLRKRLAKLTRDT